MSEDDDGSEIDFGADIYPLDWTTLRKGQDLTASQVAEATGVRSDHPRFPFAVLGLRDFIHRASADGGKPLSVCVRKGGLHINTDSEAIGYHDGRAKQNQRGIFRQLYMLSKAIDPAALTSEEQQRHTRALCLWGAKAGALRRAAQGLPAPAVTEGGAA